MSTPDMADVARLVNADARNALINLIALHIAASALDQPVSFTNHADDVTMEQLRDAEELLTAIHKAEGYALVRLPEPSVGSYTWEATEADEYHWAAVADVDEKGPYVRVRLAEREIDAEMAMRFALGVYAASVRSVAQHAAELADEHNTAAQDREEGDDRG